MSSEIEKVLGQVASELLGDMVSVADMTRGFREVRVTDRAGAVHTVRITRLTPVVALRASQRFGTSNDLRAMIRPALTPQAVEKIRAMMKAPDHQQAVEQFLNQLTRLSLMKLACVAFGLTFGADLLRKAIEAGPASFQIGLN